MAEKLALKSFRLKNFKAVRDSGTVHFTPLTVLIGDNGSGKSSLVEGLRTYQHIVTVGLNKGMRTWRGFEHITNPPLDLADEEVLPKKINPIEFLVRWKTDSGSFRTQMRVNMSPGKRNICIEKESIQQGRRKVYERNRKGEVFSYKRILPITISNSRSVIQPWLLAMNPSTDLEEDTSSDVFIEEESGFSWQFVTLNAYSMGQPRLQQRTGGLIRLEEDGSNIAEYLLDIRRRDQSAFDGIVETIQYVLPYARDLQPTLTSELERAVHLEMTEQDYRIKGWLLSTGTLRILALLALFRDPDPPPLIVIEEIENGLDPRTIHLIVEELRNLVESGRSQVIVTTHSPYLLDLLPLWSIVLVERSEDKGPVFSRPDDDESLAEWAKEFGPGSLYTMERLSRRGNG